MSISHGSGHGLLVDRWRAGEFSGVCSHNYGSGFKIQQCDGVQIKAAAHGNWGFGLHARDCGISRHSEGRVVCRAGGPNCWQLRAKNNGHRGPSPFDSPYRYSQVYLDNCSRLTLQGSFGASCNQIRGDLPSIDACRTDECPLPPQAPPQYNLTDVIPPERPNGNTNWHRVWDLDRFQPRWDGHTITWPKRSFNTTATSQVAYWRLFPALQAPARFVFRLVVQDVTGAIAEYCQRRERLAPRQAPMVCGISIDPVGGAFTRFPIWSQKPVTLTGELTVTDSRDDINLSINTWMPGMQERMNVPDSEQTNEHVLKVHEANLWRLPLNDYALGSA
jgi:hypothetical protein